MNVTVNVKEFVIEDYLCERVEALGGGHRKLQYIGRKGCADRLVVFPSNRLFLVELKKPKGGRIDHAQHEDTMWLHDFGIVKVYLFTKFEVDHWLAKVTHKPKPPHSRECDCMFCIPF